MRRLVTLGLIILVLAALWTGGWFALAAWAEDRVSTVLAEIGERGWEVQCPGRDMIGFPFALKVACGETEVAAPNSGGQADLAGVTGGASVFAPMTAEIALASPARVEAPLFSAPASFEWDETEIDVGMGMNGPQSVSFDAENFSADLPFADLPPAKIGAAAAEGSLIPTEHGGTDATVRFSGLSLSANGTALPPLDGSASAELSVPPRALLDGRDALQQPLSARDVRISLTSGSARLDAEGDLSVDTEGVVDGVIVLRVSGSEALTEFLAALPPELRGFGNALVGAMLVFGKATTLEGQPVSELRVAIERGRGRIGLFDFEVPRVPL